MYLRDCVYDGLFRNCIQSFYASSPLSLYCDGRLPEGVDGISTGIPRCIVHDYPLFVSSMFFELSDKLFLSVVFYPRFLLSTHRVIYPGGILTEGL